jgi:hypothetical protein
MSDLATSDRLHRKAMETGSNSLREAIKLARQGIYMQTPSKPVGLPRDYSIRHGG